MVLCKKRLTTRQQIKARKQQESAEVHSLRGLIAKAEKFAELPISSRTLAGLNDNHFISLTEVQRDAVPLALGGHDVLGAAKTGSGKTLAFLVPVLECLYREGWTPLQDGLGALILTPTRELALQTFDVLRKIGAKHTLSAGLIIGGKDLKVEQAAIQRMNILIATPGRLLQHLDQTASFDPSNLQILVLDEADRILDLGFAKTLDAILEALPKERQTLLFSATQTDSIKDLARLSMRQPKTISVHAKSEESTPKQLAQFYLDCELPSKLDSLFTFIRANTSSKLLVFFSSCKQVRFAYEVFCKLQPGVPVLSLHGKQKQPKRLAVFQDFCRKTAAVMFATDIAARGLDFPSIDWVVQVDCPEDVDTYVHRVGRTARYESTGSAVLMLLPSEKDSMLEMLAKKKVPITKYAGKIFANLQSIKPQLQAFCLQDPEIKYLGQKALISYARSVYLNRNRRVFDVTKLPLDDYAQALGLPGTPRLRFVARSAAKNASRQLAALSSQANSCGDSEESDRDEKKTPGKSLRKIDRMFTRKNPDVLSSHYAKLREPEDDNEDDGLFKLKRASHDLDEKDNARAIADLAKNDVLQSKRRLRLKQPVGRQHLLFDGETDSARLALPYQTETELAAVSLTEKTQEAAQYLAQAKLTISNADKEDAARQRELRRERRIAQKRKRREQHIQAASSGPKRGRIATLGSNDKTDSE